MLDFRNIVFEGILLLRVQDKNRSFFFAPFLIVDEVQLEADAENEDVADDVANDDDDED